METINIFLQRLNELMQMNNIRNVAQLSKLTQIPYMTIMNWYTRNAMPTLPNAIALAEFFDCTIDYLVGLTDNY